MTQSRLNEIIIKLSDKWSVGVVIMPKCYWIIYQSHLNKQYCWCLFGNNPSLIINKF